MGDAPIRTRRAVYGISTREANREFKKFAAEVWSATQLCTSRKFSWRLLDFSEVLLNNPDRRMPVKSSARKKRNTRQQARALDLQIQFMEGVVRRDPEYVDALQLLGDHYTQRGKYSQSLKVDERLARLQPGDPLVYYNLACSYSLNRQFDLAVEALERSLNLGYQDLNWLAKDPDLRQLRKHSNFRRIQDKIRRMKIMVR